MGWRLHLADEPLTAVQFLEGEELLVCVWLSAEIGELFAVRDGTHAGSLHLEPPNGQRQGVLWQTFLASLRAPDGRHLPVVRTDREIIHTSYDGRLRLFHRSEPPYLLLGTDGVSSALPTGDEAVLAAAFDRELGTSIALLPGGRVKLFQQYISIGGLDLDLESILGFGPPTVLLADAGALAIVASQEGIVTFDLEGHINARMAHAGGPAACSPDGGLIVTCGENGATIRIFDDHMTLLYEDPAFSLIETSEPLQLVASSPVQEERVGALAITHDGIVAFTLGGHLCLVSGHEMTSLPRSMRLL